MGFSLRIYNWYDVKGLKTVLLATHHDSRDLGPLKPAETIADSCGGQAELLCSLCSLKLESSLRCVRAVDIIYICLSMYA